MTGAPTLFRVDRLDLTFAPKPWPFASERREEIDSWFADWKRTNPSIWNGRVLLMHHQVVSDGVFRGAYLETDYASFAAWRRWGGPHTGMRDCFGAGAIISSDGAAVLGVMGAHTANAGHIYFPAGTPDPNDIVGDKVDLDVNVARELEEETGLDISEFSLESGWTTVADGWLIAQVKVLRSSESAEALRSRILAHLAQERQPELIDIRIVRSEGDFDPAMPRYVTAFLTDHFRRA